MFTEGMACPLEACWSGLGEGSNEVSMMSIGRVSLAGPMYSKGVTSPLKLMSG